MGMDMGGLELDIPAVASESSSSLRNREDQGICGHPPPGPRPC